MIDSLVPLTKWFDRILGHNHCRWCGAEFPTLRQLHSFLQINFVGLSDSSWCALALLYNDSVALGQALWLGSCWFLVGILSVWYVPWVFTSFLAFVLRTFLAHTRFWMWSRSENKRATTWLPRPKDEALRGLHDAWITAPLFTDSTTTLCGSSTFIDGQMCAWTK